MSDTRENPQNIDPDKYLYINRSLYIDNYTSKDNCIKIPINKDIKSMSSPHRYDYESLKNILEEDMGIELPIEQVVRIGDGLVDLYQSLYLEDL